MRKEIIVSSENSVVKKLRKLRDKKYRGQLGEYVVEGRRWVEDALRLCPENVVSVICSENSAEDIADHIVSERLFCEIACTENPQGIIAVMRIPEVSAVFSGTHCLFLDRVRDPGNMGAIIRTACAAGFSDIVLNDCVDVYNPKVLRSSMTGILGVKFHNACDLSEIRNNGYVTVAATLDGTDIFTSNISCGKICLVIGNEANGISENIVRSCDRKVTIPMSGNMESLNAAVSAGILMYELKFKNR